MQISEAATGVGEEMADVGMAMQRAMDKTENMRARAQAVDELEKAGTFEDLTQLDSGGNDDIDRQLKELTSSSDVDAELAKMKAELGPGGARQPALEAGSGGGEKAVRARDRPHRDRGPVPPRRRAGREAQRARQRDRVRRARRATRRASAGCSSEMLELVRGEGAELGDDELEESDVILPPPDLSLEEAGAEFTGEGLIPG